MYQVNPQRIYAMDFALQDERNVVRLERLLKGMGRDRSSVQVITPEDLPEVIAASGWIGETRQGAYPNAHDPDILFSAFQWLTPQQRQELASSDFFRRCREAHLRYAPCEQDYTGSRILAMLGAAPFHHFEDRHSWQNHYVCWTLHDLHSAWGCFHRCAYCQRGSAYAIMLNVEEFVDQVDGLLERSSWQKTFRYDVEQDVLAIEPEYGACELLVNHFAHTDDRYLILFSKSANVDFLLPLEHRGKTIMLWTLTTDTVSRVLEERTGTMAERLEAARKCQAAGYPVRFKMKPIVPLKGWREEATAMLEALFAAVQPDNLSLEMVFFDSMAEMDATVGLDNLDPAFVDAAWAAEKSGEPWDRHVDGEKPFPFAVKAEVYRHYLHEVRRLSPETPLTLCAETKRMWAALGKLIGQQPWDYVCNCGPHCTPGLRRIAPPEGPDQARIAAAVAGGAIPE